MNTKCLNLGKATKRGIKKCPKCGIYNGTRGVVCKNKRCDAVFKDCANKYRKLSLDAVRLNGIQRKIYSVRVRDRGPDQRGFVQLPLLNGSTQTDRNIFTENALCFVDSCQRLFDDSILSEIPTKNNSETNNELKINDLKSNCSSKSALLCVHIHAAIKTLDKTNVGMAIELKQDLLNSLKVSKQIKDELWLLATEKEGPIVQRVSRNVMVVKCLVSPKHPLGYLHFTFGSSKGKEIYDKYHCSCTEPNTNLRSIKCIHYWACICTLAGDAKYMEEFSFFINLEFPQTNIQLQTVPTTSKIETGIIPKSLKECLKPGKVVKKQNNRGVKNVQRQLPLKISPVSVQKEVSWSFTSWLTHVTESINQTMQFENYGNLNTLIFSIPTIFYNEFKKRIPQIYGSAFNTYHIMNILHLKEIFDTVDVKLKISKRFIHDNQNGFIEYIENETTSCQSSFIFFLNVGQTTVDETDNTNNSFLIEWIPNNSHINTVQKMGQLKLQYKYGRKST